MLTFARDDPDVFPLLGSGITEKVVPKLKQGNFAFLTSEKNYLEWKNITCDIVTAKQKLNTVFFQAIHLQKGSPLREPFNKV